MRSAQSPLVDQAGKERSGALGSDELRRLIGVSESRHVDGDTLPSDVMRSQMRRKAHRLSGHGASISTVVSESALVSANLTRTPSGRAEHGDYGELIRLTLNNNASNAASKALVISKWLAEKKLRR
jgi:hypothetical protein